MMRLARVAPLSPAARKLLLTASMLLLLQACGDSKSPTEEGQTSQTSQTSAKGAQDAESEEEEESEKPVTASQINPEFLAFGPVGMAPDQLIIETDVTLTQDPSSGKVDAEKTQLVIEPPISGTLSYRSERSLVFRPQGSFKPGRTYKVSLNSIHVREQTVTPDAAWTHEFTTPEFAFKSISTPVRIDAQTVEVEVVFSAPPQDPDLGSLARWAYDGKQASAVSYRRGSDASIVSVTLKSPSFGRSPNKELTLTLKEGVAFDADIKAASASASSQVIAGPEVDILNVYHKEGTSGFYVEVVCDDDGVPGEKRYYWDRQIYEDFELSSRCMPTLESAKQAIVFSPAIDFEIAPSSAGFRIFGDFKRRTYNLQLKPGMRTDAGGILRVTYNEDMVIPERKPSVNFTSKGRYIPREAWGQLPIQHLNTPKLEVTLRHIPKDNLIFWMSGGDEQASERVANIVHRSEVAVKAPEDQDQTSWLDVSAMVPDPKPGVYEVEVTGRDKTDETRLLITDLNLVAKRSASAPGAPWSKEIYAWTFGMQDIKPRSGVTIEAVRPSGSVLASCKTDGGGGCVLTLPEEGVDETPPFALIASKGDDFTYLKYSDLKTEGTGSDTYGRPYLDEQRYTAVIYGDRDLYRPGETGHFVGMLRMASSHQAPKKGLPVELLLRDARSRLVTRKVVKTNSAGLVDFDEAFADFAPTGRWRVEAKVGKKLVASYSFGVEEFVPERMRVKGSFAKADALVGTPMEVDVSAKYLFGGSAEESKVEVQCWLRPSTFSPKKNKDYTYTPAPQGRAETTLNLGTQTGQISADDTASINCPVTDAAQAFGISGEISANISVFEAGSGRTTTTNARAKVHPAPYYIGMKTQTRKARAGKDFEVEGVVVDWEGELVNGVSEVELTMVRMVSEYGWYFDENLGYERYHWYRRPVQEGKIKASVKGGRFKATLSPREDGAAFVVQASANKASTGMEVPGARQSYYWWSNDSSTDYTPGPQKPSSINFEVPEVVNLNEDITVEFDAPFEGRALLTLETHRVLEQKWMEVKAGKNTWTTKAKSFTPNVYISALVVKNPHLDSKDAFLPARAMGTTSVKIRPQNHTQDVTIKAPKEVRSESELEITLELGPQNGETFATVAVVDEGVLSLSKFKTPDPNATIFARRALGVETYDTVGWAMQLEQLRAKSGGGDDYEGEEGKSGEAGDAGLGRPKAIKPVALWSGVVPVSKSGKATVKFKLPLYRGALRVMAVTASKDRVGSAEAEVIVRDPITIQSTLPRFLTAGDEVHIPVFVSNVSGKKRDIKVVFEAEEQTLSNISKAKLPDSPLVQLISQGTKSMTLEDGKSETAIFRVKGLRQSGIARFKVIASDGDASSRDEGIVPFIPAGPKETKVTRLEVEAGTTDLTSALAGWEPTSEQTTFWLTTNPYGQAFDHLKYLIRYPYGCIEQTTSSTRPLLFVSDVLTQVAPELAPEQEEIDKMVRHGIRRVLSMQTSGGGFAYWPGGRTPDAWGTAYAAHMLLDARTKGYDIPADRLDSALQWLEDSIGRTSYPYAEPYMHYVLAVAKRGQKARAQQLLQFVQTAPKNAWYRGGRKQEMTYMLKASLHLMGDHRYERELKSPDVSSINADRSYGYSYYSDLRRRALTLNIFFDLFGKDAKGELLAQLVGNQLSQDRSSWYTTQELVWGVTALGKWVEGSAASFEGGSLSVNGSAFEVTQTNPKKSDMTWKLLRASEYDSIKLTVASKSEGKLYMIISSEGVRTSPTVEWGGDGLRLTREYVDSDGKLISLDDIKLGDVLFSRVTLKNVSGEKIENVALVERFPAGWEIENPNLGRGELPPALNAKLWNTDHMNMRDDRVEAFGTLYGRDEVTVVVGLRATSAGSFKSPPASAEAMYDPTKWARLEGRGAVVLGPWED